LRCGNGGIIKYQLTGERGEVTEFHACHIADATGKSKNGRCHRLREWRALPPRIFYKNS
jgi:hypothetical protein